MARKLDMIKKISVEPLPVFCLRPFNYVAVSHLLQQCSTELHYQWSLYCGFCRYLALWQFPKIDASLVYLLTCWFRWLADIWAGGSGDAIPNGEGGRTVGQQQSLRPCSQRLDRELEPRCWSCAASEGRQCLDQLAQSVRCCGRVRRISTEWIRTRRRKRGPARRL